MRKKPIDILFLLMVWGSAATTLIVLIFLVGHILINGVPYITPSLFELTYTSQNVSLLPSLISTIFAVLISLAVSVPFGTFTAIYLVEYAKKGNMLVRIIRVTVETLAGIPSIVYGLFGMLFFVTYLGWGFSLLAGSLTLSMMTLPLIIRTTEESLKSVPDSYREASFGLGAGRLRTVFRIVLPSAAPGILAGVILSIGRVIGETAAMIATAGTVVRIPESVFQSSRTLAVHMWALASEGFHIDQAYATAVVLLGVVVGINTIASMIAKKLSKG